MCFGNMQTTQQKTDNTNSVTNGTTSQSGTTSQNLPDWLTGAGQQNVNSAANLQTKGYQPYTGSLVAGMSPAQVQALQLATSLGQNPANANPYAGTAGNLFTQYANAPASTVSANTIASQMSPYMSAYVQQALQPQLQLQQQQFAQQNKDFNAAATGSGAFGDTSWALGKGNLTQQQDIANQGLIGNAYNAAFNTAIGAGAQDVSNNLNAQTTNAGLKQQSLTNMLQGGTALSNLGNTNLSTQMGLANFLQQQGAVAQNQNQNVANADYQQYLLAQQYPFLTSQNLNSAITSGRQAAPTSTNTTANGTTLANTVGNSTSTTQAPNNAGYGILGSLLGSAANVIAPGIGSLFGGGGTGAGLSDASNWNSSLPVGSFAGFADGGVAPGGQPAIVGERGPELIVPNATSMVIPNEVLEAARKMRSKRTGNAPSSIEQQLGLAA